MTHENWFDIEFLILDCKIINIIIHFFILAWMPNSDKSRVIKIVVPWHHQLIMKGISENDNPFFQYRATIRNQMSLPSDT